MDMATLRSELKRLPAEEQDRLAAFLTALRMRREGLMTELQDRLSDEDPANWVAWEDAKKELGLNGRNSEG